MILNNLKPINGFISRYLHSGRSKFALPAILAIALSGLSSPALAQSNDLRKNAAASTAENSAACKALSTFYWEIGDRSAKLAEGTHGSIFPPGANDLLPIYSASKWLLGRTCSSGVAASSAPPRFNISTSAAATPARRNA